MGHLAAQPSDFLACDTTQTVLLEVKECKTENRLPYSKIRQYGKLNLFHHAGALVLVPVFRSAVNDWVCLTNRHLFGFDPVPKAFPLTDLPRFPTAAALLEDAFA